MATKTAEKKTTTKKGAVPAVDPTEALAQEVLLLSLHRALVRLGEPARVLLGFRDRARASGAALLAGATLATDDGSVGHHGLVTELLLDQLDGHVAVYACGPAPMLEAVRRLCAHREVPAQLALESGMACGFGACFGCVVATRRGYLRLCVDGPVLDADILDGVVSH